MKPDFKISITNRKKLENINRKFDGIFHLAAGKGSPSTVFAGTVNSMASVLFLVEGLSMFFYAIII